MAARRRDCLMKWIRVMRWLARPLAMTAMWLTATGFFGMAYFLSGRSIRVEEGIIFTVTFGTAAAVSAVIALAIGAERRWAIEAALPIAILMAAPVGTAGALTWLAPTMGGNIQAAGYFPQYRGRIPAAVLGVSMQTIPIAAILGAGIGAISGLSIVLGRCWSRLVGWFLVLLFVSCIIGSMHIIVFDRVVDLLVQNITFELPAAIGATAGAVVGAVVASGAVRLSDGSRRSRRYRDTTCSALESGSRSGA
jgi:hypothetical protein